MNYKINSVSDYSSIKDIFAGNFGRDSARYEYLRPSNLFATEQDGNIIAAGALFSNELHDKVPVMAIAVDENFRRKGLATKIHKAILEANPNIPLGIDGACFDFDEQAQGFMKSLNYRRHLDCVTPLIDLNAGIQNIPNSIDFNILTFDEAFKAGFTREVIAEFLAERYSASHHWSPVALLPDNPLWQEICLDKADMSLSALATINGEILGASTALARNDMLQINWSFTKQYPLNLQLEILKKLFDFQFKLGISRNLSVAVTECDSTDEAMAMLPKDLTVLESETWLRFRFKL